MTPGRAGPPLRFRIAAWVAAATALLAVISLVVAFVAARAAMRSDLQEALRRDAAAAAAAYEGAGAGGAAVAPSTPTGRLHIQLYGADGVLFAASDPAFEREGAALPPSVVTGAPDAWRGSRTGVTLQAATAPFSYGVVAVLAETAYIGRALEAIARALLVAALALLALSIPVGLLAARAATRPIRRLADAASRLGPEDLDPLALPVPRDEVGQLAGVLDALLDRLREARDAQRAFLAETSHELRTPLTSLRGFLRRARRGAGPEADQDLADAERIAGGMGRLVEDLLELSRSRLVRDITPHLVDPLREVAEPVAAEFPGVTVEGEAGLAVLAEPDRLRQALRNLVANAVRSVGSEGRVEVRCRASHASVHLEVHDDGPGLAPEVRERLFEPFRPGPGGGTGLGLAIARQLMEAHGGSIHVAGGPGETVFTLSLPRAEEDAPEGGAEADAVGRAAHESGGAGW